MKSGRNLSNYKASSSTMKKEVAGLGENLYSTIRIPGVKFQYPAILQN